MALLWQPWWPSTHSLTSKDKHKMIWFFIQNITYLRLINNAFWYLFHNSFQSTQVNYKPMCSSRNALAFMRFPILMVLMRNSCSNHIVLIRNYMGFSSIKRQILRLIYVLTFAAVFSIPMKSWFAGTVVRTFCVVTRGVAMTTMMAFHTFVNI